MEDLTTVPRWARVTELNHAITNAKIDASRLLAQEIVAPAVAYELLDHDGGLIMVG